MLEYGIPHYCKIDIEDCDLEALKSLKNIAEPPPFISIESEKLSWSRLMDELLTFRELGYSRYKVVDQSLIELQSCPGHKFEAGSSGLFGDDIPGPWISLPEAVAAYKSIFLNYALNGDSGLFTRGTTGLFTLLARIQGKLTRKLKSSAYVTPNELLPSPGWYDTHAAH
jgi:hypothetical protein